MANDAIKILIADDDRSIRNSIQLVLSDETYELAEAATIPALYQQFERFSPDLILLDIHFENNLTSIDFIKSLADKKIDIPIIILSGASSIAEALEAIKLGVYDFLEKPVSSERLKLTIKKCLEHYELKIQLKQVTSSSSSLNYEIIGNGPQIQKIKSQIANFGAKDIKVLITGETGVGKEVVAYSLWQHSARHRFPFILVNSAAIPDNLLESELFGHKRGAFTGAVSDQLGKIEMADRGTLFLDEIGDLSPHAQTKLLRFLETGEIQKIGAQKTKIVDVRIIAATSRDLMEEIKKERFRADLYYRLNVVHLEMPPLRERREDIPLLFHYFIQKFCLKFSEPIKETSLEAYHLLQSYSWPGNVRELRNVAEKSVIYATSMIDKNIILDILPKIPLPADIPPATAPVSDSALPLNIMAFKDYKLQMEKDYLQKVLSFTQGSVAKAAELLSLDRTYLYQKLNKHRIKFD